MNTTTETWEYQEKTPIWGNEWVSQQQFSSQHKAIECFNTTPRGDSVEGRVIHIFTKSTLIIQKKGD